MRRIFAFLTLLVCVFTLASCRSSADPAELREALASLAPRARELYGVIYGDSAAHEPISGENGYYLVTDEVYSSEAAIREALLEVFTEGYAEILCNTAFNGVSSEEGAIGAKFRTELDGSFTVKPSVTSHIASPREFDLDSLEVVRQNAYLAIVSIASASGERVEVTLQMTREGWRLDSALF